MNCYGIRLIKALLGGITILFLAKSKEKYYSMDICNGLAGYIPQGVTDILQKEVNGICRLVKIC